MKKRICCITSENAQNEVKVLLDEIQSRIHLTIPILSTHESIIDYEVVIFVLSNSAINDFDLNKQLQEASGLNKIFLPIIIGGNWWKDWLLKRKYKGPDLHTGIYSLRKVSHMLSFYTQLMSFSGATIIGDPFGCVYTFRSDVDCQIIRNHDIIAEIYSGESKNVTLYLGNHKLKLQSVALDLEKDVNIHVDDIDNNEETIIEMKFIPDIKITSSIDCSIHENNEFLTYIQSGEEKILKLLPGHHKLKFQHPLHKNLNRYINVKIKVNEDKKIVYEFPKSPKECSYH